MNGGPCANGDDDGVLQAAWRALHGVVKCMCVCGSFRSLKWGA